MEGDTSSRTGTSEETATTLAVLSLLVFALTVIPAIFAGLWKGKLDPDLIKFIENLASIEIGPIGVVFGFYFSRHIR